GDPLRLLSLPTRRSSDLRLLRALHPGMKEFEAEAELTFIFTQHGCSHAFEPIIASGKSACTLHYTRNNGVIGKDELVLIDFGAEIGKHTSELQSRENLVC